MQSKKSMKKQKDRLMGLLWISSTILILLVVITILLVTNKINQEKLEEEEIQALIEEASLEEHEVQEVKEPAPVVLPELNYTYDELKLLAHLIEAESGGDSEVEMWSMPSGVRSLASIILHVDTHHGWA